jgi:hypothetical protein
MLNVTDKHESNASWMRILGFTIDDLQLNSTGKITNAQAVRLLRLRNLSMAQPCLFLVAGVSMAYLAVVDFHRTNDYSKIVFLGLSILFILIVITWSYIRWAKISNDIQELSAKKAVGNIFISNTQQRGIGYYGTSFVITINDVALIIPSSLREFIDQTQQYIVYYCANSKVIISMSLR